MVGEGEGHAGGSGEEAGVVVGGAVFAVLDQVSVAGVCRRVDLSGGVSGEVWMVAGGLEDAGVAVTECGSIHVPGPGAACREGSHRVVGCGPVCVVVEGVGGVGEGGADAGGAVAP